MTEKSQKYKRTNEHIQLNIFMHLADAFIQSDLHCIQVTVLHFISSHISTNMDKIIKCLILANKCYGSQILSISCDFM